MRMCFTDQAHTWEELSQIYQVNQLEFKLLNPQLAQLSIVPIRSKIRIPQRSYQQVPQPRVEQEVFEIDYFDEEQVRQFYDALFRERKNAAQRRAQVIRDRKHGHADYLFQIPLPQFDPNETLVLESKNDRTMDIINDVLNATQNEALNVNYSEKSVESSPVPKPEMKPNLRKRPVLYPNIPGVWVNQQPTSIK